MQTYYDMNIEPASILGRRVSVMGFGAQGRAHALNLRDSGVDVVVGLRTDSPSRGICKELGLAVQTPSKAAASSDVVVMLVPDQIQPALYRETLADSMTEGSAMVFAHGYSIHFRHIEPRQDLDVLMVAPLGIGDQVRALYEAGRGVPALLALHQDASGTARDLGLGYAWANGHGRAGIFETSFSDETETDLFAGGACLFRVSPRGETYRGSCPSARHIRHAEVDIEHGGVWRLLPRAAHNKPGESARHAGDPG
jgi:ketol-acid reductoisomerase